MGVKNLNRYLLKHTTSIKKAHLSDFANKTVVIDASIYMYRFNDSRFENMYVLISIFKDYHIKPIFIFDGKPPPEKLQLIEERRAAKRAAQDQYNQLNSDLGLTMNAETKRRIIDEMSHLATKFIRITDADNVNIQELLTAYGVQWTVADGEADALCAHMVLTGKAWACMSDDMDMLVYGCTRVFRNLSLTNHTIIYYNIDVILKELSLTLREFKQIAVVAGTDYNANDMNIDSAMELFKTFKASGESDFFERFDYDKLTTIYHLFTPNISEYNIAPARMQISLYKLMEKEGFVFI